MNLKCKIEITYVSFDFPFSPNTPSQKNESQRPNPFFTLPQMTSSPCEMVSEQPLKYQNYFSIKTQLGWNYYWNNGSIYFYHAHNLKNYSKMVIQEGQFEYKNAQDPIKHLSCDLELRNFIFN